MIKKPGAGSTFTEEPWKGSLASAGEANFFSGGFQTNEFAVDPLVSGYAFIFWTKVPKWVEDEFPGFRQMTQRNFRALGGIGNFEISGISTQAGFTANENLIAGMIAKQQGLTLTHKEFSGSPIRNSYTYWQTGIRDPETGIARYPKEAGIPYAQKNHTGELLYVQTRPDADNVDGNIIEFAQYYTGVWPMIVPRDHHNHTAGTSDQVEMEITLAGKQHQSPEIDAFAATKMRSGEAYKFVTEGEFTSNTFGG